MVSHERAFPSYTTVELEQMLNSDRPIREITRLAIEEEIAARKAGISKPKVTPQLAWS